MQAELEKIVREVADEMGIPQHVALKAYATQWEFILEKAQSLPLKDISTIEEFRELRPNFNIPSFGKFFITEQRFLNLKKRREMALNIRAQQQQNQEENVQD